MNGKELLQAVERDNLNEVKKLILEDGADPDFVTRDWTPLTMSIHKTNAKIACFLIENGANINLASGDGWTPAYVATKENQIKVLEKLLEHGLAINAPVPLYNETLINIAHSNNKLEMAAMLLEKGAVLPPSKMDDILTVYRTERNKQTIDFFEPLIKWQKSSDYEIIHHHAVREFNITSIFNFNAMNILTILQDKNKNIQSHDKKHFSEPAVDIELLLQAKQELIDKGGSVDDFKFTQSLRAPIRKTQAIIRTIKARKR